jgi:Protein of unknown function (DUF3302)
LELDKIYSIGNRTIADSQVDEEATVMDLVTGPLDLYDYLMFLFVIIMLVAFFTLAIFILGLPGKVALQRKHPHAETVKWMGWAGFLVVIPWVHALIWAFHDSLTIDIRRFPAEERDAIEKELARLGGSNSAKPETNE